MRRPLQTVAIVAAGFVSATLPRGEFGAHDIAIRAGICGVVAGLMALLLTAFATRSQRQERH
jgi:hypothetical protein